MTLNPWRAGMALGVFLGGWHLAWSIMVAIGWADAILQFILRIHFLQLQVSMAPFDVNLAATLVVVTTLVGFVLPVVVAVNKGEGLFIKRRQ